MMGKLKCVRRVAHPFGARAKVGAPPFSPAFGEMVGTSDLSNLSANIYLPEDTYLDTLSPAHEKQLRRASTFRIEPLVPKYRFKRYSEDEDIRYVISNIFDIKRLGLQTRKISL
jgi:hypothetical protein